MRVTVHTTDQTFEFDAVTNVCTDEHNNLEVIRADGPAAVFNKAHWEAALYGEAIDDN